MKIASYEAYRDLAKISIREVPVPRIRPNQILLRVHTSSVTTADWRVQSLALDPGFQFIGRLVFGWNRPRCRSLGTEASGVVEAIGDQVKEWAVGDRVLVVRDSRFGCHVEYLAIDADEVIVKIPDTLSHEEAVAFPFGFLTANAFLFEKTKLQSGEKLLVRGGSGSVGSAAIQLGHLVGAEVTAIASKDNSDFMKSLGATTTLDYRTEDFRSLAAKYDVILDTVGDLGLKDYRSHLNVGGRLAHVAAPMVDVLRSTFQSSVFAGPIFGNRNILQSLLANLEAGKLKAPIDRTYPLEDVRSALEYVSHRHRRGNIILKMTT